MEMNFRIIPSIVTTTDKWRERIEETKKLQIKELAFFPTCLSGPEREEAYKLLESNGIKSIPFVHLKNDMSPEELDYLIRVFGTRKFNIHAQKSSTYKLVFDLSKYQKMIFLENSTFPWEDTLNDWAGICLDVSHLESEQLRNGEVLADWYSGLEKHPVGAWHVSAIYDPPISYPGYDKLHYDVHRYDNLKRFDYVQKYRKFLAEIIALELENTIEEQLEAKKYLERILN